MEGYNEKILSAEQQEKQEKFAELLPFIGLIKSKINQDIADSFIEQMDEQNISFKDYDLSNNFLSYISSDTEDGFEPVWSDSSYDTDKRKIESIIISLAKDSQAMAA